MSPFEWFMFAIAYAALTLLGVHGIDRAKGRT